jgi:hypothetical protein
LFHRPSPDFLNPKKTQPFQRVPVIALAMADNDL